MSTTSISCSLSDRCSTSMFSPRENSLFPESGPWADLLIALLVFLVSAFWVPARKHISRQFRSMIACWAERPNFPGALGVRACPWRRFWLCGDHSCRLAPLLFRPHFTSIRLPFPPLSETKNASIDAASHTKNQSHRRKSNENQIKKKGPEKDQKSQPLVFAVLSPSSTFGCFMLWP